ncbi:hypothetical protein GCM10009422_05630 [Brevundimonas kwangchunensis]|uniref:UrcA family protein n=1 Tax=Brevundimonas kwangchunensis TaxID=322163 RepID=A0ABN1GKS1_9CAUL
MKVLASVTVACVLAAAAGAAGAASAQSARVSFGDLDLSTISGADAFDARVDTAARKVCRGARRTGSAITDREACRVAVQTEALASLPSIARADYASARRTLDL